MGKRARARGSVRLHAYLRGVGAGRAEPHSEEEGGALREGEVLSRTCSSAGRADDVLGELDLLLQAVIDVVEVNGNVEPRVRTRRSVLVVRLQESLLALRVVDVALLRVEQHLVRIDDGHVLLVRVLVARVLICGGRGRGGS